jgi:hypothetical protein
MQCMQLKPYQLECASLINLKIILNFYLKDIIISKD